MNKFIEKIGMDKVAHFGVGGFVTAIITMIFLLQDMGSLVIHPWRAMFYPFIGTVVTAVISVLKEKFIDLKPDWKDVYAALIGSIPVFISVLLGILFYVGTVNLQ